MEEVKTFKEKKEEMMEKYQYAINAISVANNVDVGVAFDMLLSNANGVGEHYDYVNEEELKKDAQELEALVK